MYITMYVYIYICEHVAIATGGPRLGLQHHVAVFFALGWVKVGVEGMYMNIVTSG